jgi:hypothetical protein
MQQASLFFWCQLIFFATITEYEREKEDPKGHEGTGRLPTDESKRKGKNTRRSMIAPGHVEEESEKDEADAQGTSTGG